MLTRVKQASDDCTKLSPKAHTTNFVVWSVLPHVHAAIYDPGAAVVAMDQKRSHLCPAPSFIAEARGKVLSLSASYTIHMNRSENK